MQALNSLKINRKKCNSFKSTYPSCDKPCSNFKKDLTLLKMSYNDFNREEAGGGVQSRMPSSGKFLVKMYKFLKTKFLGGVAGALSQRESFEARGLQSSVSILTS